MVSILIIGGAGFIGSDLTEALLTQDYRLGVLDDLSSGSIENLAGVRSNPRLEVVPEKVENLPILAEMVDRPAAIILNNIGGTEVELAGRVISATDHYRAFGTFGMRRPMLHATPNLFVEMGESQIVVPEAATNIAASQFA